MLVQPYFQLKIKIAESNATRNLFSRSFFCCPCKVFLYLIAKVGMGTPLVVAFLINKWCMRHLSTNDAIEEFLQSQNKTSCQLVILSQKFGR